MPSEWYYTRSRTKYGPISAKDLKHLAQSGSLQPTDLVWKHGMDRWVPAHKVRGLFPQDPVLTVSPPVPTTPGAVKPENRLPRIKNAQSLLNTLLSVDWALAQRYTGRVAELLGKFGKKHEPASKTVQSETESPIPSVASVEPPFGDVSTTSKESQLLKRRVLIGGLGCLGLMIVLGAAGALVGGLREMLFAQHPGRESYAELQELLHDFEAVYIVQPRQLLTDYRSGVGPGESSLLFFRGGVDGIRRIAVGVRGNDKATMYIEESNGRLVKLNKETLFDTKWSGYRDAGVNYKLADGIVSGSWRYKSALFGGDGTVMTDVFAFKLGEHNRYQLR